MSDIDAERDEAAREYAYANWRRVVEDHLALRGGYMIVSVIGEREPHIIPNGSINLRALFNALRAKGLA